MILGKMVRNIILFAFITGFCAVLNAQDSLKKATSTPVAPAQSNPSTSNNGINNPNLTVPPIIRPIEDYAPRPRRRRLTAADSARIAAKRDLFLKDSLQKAMVAAGNLNTIPSAFNIGTQTPAVDSAANALVQPAPTAIPAVPILNSSDNPFEILRGAATTPDTTTLNTHQKSIDPVPSNLLDKKVYSKNFLFWIFLVTLMLMAFVVANARSMISNSYTAIINDNALRLINKQSFGWGNALYLALYALFWINGGILAFLLMSYFGVKSPYGQSVTFLLCVGGVAIMFILKHIVLYIIAHVFPIEKEIKTYNFIVLTGGILLGLLLMPLNILIAYSPVGLSKIFIYMTFGVIGLVYLVRSLRSLTIASPYLMENRFHFLLYLCTVEIAPLMIVIKLIILGAKM